MNTDWISSALRGAFGQTPGGSAAASCALQVAHVFGAKTNVENCIHFADAGSVCYCCGRLIALHRINNKTQKFIVGSDEALETTCLAVSPTKRCGESPPPFAVTAS